MSSLIMKKMSICVAVAKNGVIGANGTIPWPRLKYVIRIHYFVSEYPVGPRIVGRFFVH